MSYVLPIDWNALVDEHCYMPPEHEGVLLRILQQKEIHDLIVKFRIIYSIPESGINQQSPEICINEGAILIELIEEYILDVFHIPHTWYGFFYNWVVFNELNNFPETNQKYKENFKDGFSRVGNLSLKQSLNGQVTITPLGKKPITEKEIGLMTICISSALLNRHIPPSGESSPMCSLINLLICWATYEGITKPAGVRSFVRQKYEEHRDRMLTKNKRLPAISAIASFNMKAMDKRFERLRSEWVFNDR